MKTMPETNRDPRSEADFAPELFPECDRESLPAAGSLPPCELAFLTAYYDLNVASRALDAYRRDRPKGTVDSNVERRLLMAVEKTLLAKESVEDQYAPLGIWARPTIENGVVISVELRKPPVPGEARFRTIQSSSLFFRFGGEQ